MSDSPGLNVSSDAPIYTIKTVVQQTGITSATLRAWERRYNVLAPDRSEGGYRLYSERDIATLLWLKAQLEAGISISRAAARLHLLQEAGEQPGQPGAAADAGLAAVGVRSAAILLAELVAALLAFNEAEAECLLNEAFSLYPVETAAEEIIAPALVDLGERWHRGEASVVQEHFATAFLRRRLTALFSAYHLRASGPLAIVGSAAGEWHDVGILMVALALRRHGWRVIYLGQNVPAQHLLESITRLRPALVCLSATTEDSALRLTEVAEVIASLPLASRPRLALGGRGFNEAPQMRQRFPGAIFAVTARGLADAVA